MLKYLVATRPWVTERRAVAFSALLLAASCSDGENGADATGGGANGGLSGAAGAGGSAGSGASAGSEAGAGEDGGVGGTAGDAGSGGVGDGGAPGPTGGRGSAEMGGSTGAPTGGTAGAAPTGGSSGADTTGTDGGSISGGRGASGEGGAGGSGAAGGTGPECQSNEDCARTEVCVTQVCEAGRCVARSACANPDPYHCVAACVPETGFAQCIVVPRDHDRDGHGDASCVASTQGVGDDCDDEEPLISVGKTELCDGRDNNCNRIGDLTELGAGGETQMFRSMSAGGLWLHAAPPVWSDEAGAFGVAWEEDDSEDQVPRVYFNLVTSDGDQRLIAPARLTLNEAPALTPALAHNGSHFGVAWIDHDSEAPGLYFATVTSAGVPGSPLLVANGREFEPTEDLWPIRDRPLVLSAFADGSFALFWPGDGALMGRAITPSGTLAGSEAKRLVDGPLFFGLQAAVTGQRVALVWSRWTGNLSVVQGTLLDADLESLLPSQASHVSLSPPLVEQKRVTEPTLATASDGFLLSWAEAAPGSPVAWRIMRRGPNLLDERCSALSTTDVSVKSLMWHGGQGLLSGTRAGEKNVALATFDDRCQLLETTDVYQIALESHHRGVALAAGDGGFALLWTTENVFDASQTFHRFFGPRLCDPFASPE